MNPVRTLLLLLCLFASSLQAATYYIDYASGADTNAGSKTAPWKRHPYMRGWGGTYSAQAGDRFIFKGGVVWPGATLPMKPTVSGASGNPMYYGIDQTWYSGAAWSRPCLDGEYAVSTGIDIGSLNWLTFEGLELKRVTSSASYGYGLFQGGAPSNILLRNLYVHGWQTTSSTDDAHGGVVMMGYSSGVDTLVMENCEIENSENQSRWNGVAVRMWGTIRNCKIHHNSSAVLFCLDFDGNDLYNICHPVAGFDGAYHFNGVYLDAATVSKNLGYFRNNRVRDCGGGANMAYLNPRSAKLYCYNNVFWGEISDQRAIEVEPYNYGAGGADGEVYIYNNTGFIESSSPFIHVVNRGGNPKVAKMVTQNNHVIGTSVSVHDGNSTSVGTITDSNNLVQTGTVASGQGYTSANHWAPTGTSSSTVNQGISVATLFTKDINGNGRVAPWDIGAYEFGASGGGNAAPTVSAITQNIADADSGTSGLQINLGSTAQYSATASDSNGDAISWAWRYSRNGAADTAVSSGTGTVSPATYNYANASSGDTFVWKLTVSDGQATASSQLTVSVVTTAAVTPPATTGTYYIDYAAGADSNSGAKSAPWKRHPYMVGWAGTYTPQAGDRFIFKGGVVWPSATLPLKPTASGAANNPTYYGIDQTWFAGSAWSRPCLDGEYRVPTGINIASYSWMTFEGLELKRVTSAASNGYGLFLGGAPSNILLKNLYIHGWQTTNAVDDAHGGVIMTGYQSGVDTLVMEDCEIENAENQSRWNGVAVRMWGTIRNCKIHHNSSAVLFCLDFDGNDLYNICHPVGGFDGVYHPNGVYLDALTMNKSVGYFRNSRVRDVSGGANMAYLNPRGAKLYCYNNIFWGEISDQRAVEVEPYNYGAGGTDGEAYVYNNTAYIEPSTPLIRVVDRGGNPKISKLVAQNNHVIGTNVSMHDGNATTVATLTVSNNVLQTDTTAGTQGYTSANLWAPTSSGGATVNQGMSMATLFTKDVNGGTRVAPWDIGAYEYGGSGGANVGPTVSSISQSVADADSAASGLQVYVGTNVNYSASASDPNGDAIAWNWSYSKNGGADTAVSSGTGTISSVAFNYANAAVGDSFVWKIQVSDGQVTASNQLTVSVIAQPAAVPSPGGSYYIDYATGVDTNAGTKAAPWKRHPYMRGWAGSYAPQAGDRYIFKGGVIWPSATLPLRPTVSGATSNPTYYGIDSTWFTGAAWARPCFDGEYAVSTGIDIGSLSWMTFEGLELKRVTSSSNYGYGLIQGGAPSNILLKNCYLHGWQTTSGTDDAHGGVIMGSYSSGVNTLVMEGCEIENAENQARWNGVAVRMWGTIRNSKIHHNSSAVLFCLDFDGNDLYNICHPVGGFDGAYHFNGVYMDAATLSKNIGYFRNNRVRDCGGGANMAYLNPRGAKLYCYNNVFWGEISDQRAIEVEPYNYGAGGADGEVYVYNNTGNIEASSPLIRVVNRGGNPKVAKMVVQNNHVIGTSVSVHDGNTTTVGTITDSNNLVQTATIASGQGYTSTNTWAPTGGTSGTVNQGTSVATLFTADINGNARTAPWDIGAYEMGAATNVAPTVSAISQDAQDADAAATGFQVYVGAIVQYSATASDINGDALSWTWKYSKNGAADTTVSSGSGPINPATFDYSSASAGNTYVWKLQVSDAQLSATSQMTVSVIAAPLPEDGFYIEAESGKLSGGFVAESGSISQPTQTTLTDANAGRAVYPITITVAGDYVIYGIVDAPNDASNSLFFNVDAEPTDPASVWQIPLTAGMQERIGSWQGTGTWDNPQFVPQKFTLTKGTHTIIVRGREAGTKLDKIKVVKLPASPKGVRAKGK